MLLFFDTLVVFGSGLMTVGCCGRLPPMGYLNPFTIVGTGLVVHVVALNSVVCMAPALFVNSTAPFTLS